MPRKKIDVEQIGWSEQISEDVSISGSFTVDGSTKIKSNALVNQKAIQFDGTTPFDEVTISDSTTATSFSSGGGTDKPFTISMWVNLDEIDYDGTTVLNMGALYSKRSTSSQNGEIYIGVVSGYLQLILYADPDQNGVGSFSTTNRIVVSGGSGNFRFFHAENTWFHVCITYDGTKALSGIRIYKNSHPVGTSTILDGDSHSTANPDLNVPNQVFFGTMAVTNYSGMPQTSIPATLGGIDATDSTNTAFAGKLADVCRFNRVLTHTEVQELYNDGKVKNMEEHSAYSDLVHWWKMGDHIDTTGQDGIKDYVGGYHGTLEGDASIVSETTLGSDTSSTVHFNSSGSVGVGTSNPDSELDVIGNSEFLGDVQVDGNIHVETNLTVDGKIGIGTTDPAYKLSVGGNMEVGQYIYHKGDNNTWINFTDNRIRLNAGGNNFIDCEDPGSAPHKVRINNGGNNIDFIIKDNDNDVYFTADASTSRVGIGTGTPDEKLHVSGNIKVEGEDPRIKIDGITDSHPGLEFYENGTRKWIIFNNYGDDSLDFKTNSNTRMSIEQGGNIGIGTQSPATVLHINGALTIGEKSSDPSDPAEGHSVLWMSDGTGTGDDGDILIKITAGGVTKTVTLVDFSAS